MSRLDHAARLSVIFLAGITLFAVLDLAENILAPVALALTAGVVLSPLSDAYERAGFPPVVGALSLLALTLGVVAGIAVVMQPIIAQLVDQAPKVWSDMQDMIEIVKGLARGMSDITDGVSDAIAPDANAAVTEAAPAAEPEVELPTVTDALLIAPSIAAQIFVFMGTLFFFVLTRREIYDWLAKTISGPTERAVTARRLREAERKVSSYFVTVTIINAGLGLATAAVLQLMGLPGALLWGLVAFLLNFVLYLGPAIFAVSLLFAGIASFDGLMAAAPAAAFVTLNAIEGQFVTPATVGKRLSVNPLLVFLALVLGLWLWGPLGGIVAMPLLLWVLVLNDGLRTPAEDGKKVREAA